MVSINILKNPQILCHPLIDIFFGGIENFNIFASQLTNNRRDGRVVDCGGLENR